MKSNQVTVHIPVPLRRLAEGRTELETNASCVREALDAVCDRYPDLRRRIFDADHLRPGLNVYVNREDLRYLDGLDTPLRGGDELRVLSPATGG